jgi:hypothetical protein
VGTSYATFECSKVERRGHVTECKSYGCRSAKWASCTSYTPITIPGRILLISCDRATPTTSASSNLDCNFVQPDVDRALLDTSCHDAMRELLAASGSTSKRSDSLQSIGRQGSLLPTSQLTVRHSSAQMPSTVSVLFRKFHLAMSLHTSTVVKSAARQFPSFSEEVLVSCGMPCQSQSQRARAGAQRPWTGRLPGGSPGRSGQRTGQAAGGRAGRLL